MRPGAKGKLVAALVVGLVGLWPATPASAHAVLVETDPVADTIVDQSPERVTATFNEAVEIAFGALRVYDTEGARVDRGDSEHLGGDPKTVSIALEPDLPAGTYTGTYRVVSADGHPVEAAFVFHVERPGERPQGIGETLLSGGGGSGTLEQTLYGLARWALFAGMTMLVGAVGFLALVWARSGGRAPALDEAFVKRWRTLARAGWWTSAIASIAGFFLQGAVAADVGVLDALSPGVASELLSTRYGQVAVVRLAALAALAGCWVFAARSAASAPEWPLRRESTAGAAAATPSLSQGLLVATGITLAVLAATPGLSGHAGATAPIVANVTADTVHVLAAGVWIGGLVTLIVCCYRSVTETEPSARAQLLAPVVSRFSDLAMVCVALLVVTGVYRTWIEVRALGAFVDAPYGWVLLTKLGVFVPLLVLGGINNRLLKPRIERAADASALGTLRRVVMVEVVLGVVVLGLTALLVNLPPARVEAGVSGPFIDDVALGESNLNVVIDPNEVGQNIVHLTATTPSGTPSEIKSMKVRFSMPAEDIGPITSDGRELAPGHFVVEGRQLSVPGEWVLEIEARIDKFTNERAEVKVSVKR